MVDQEVIGSQLKTDRFPFQSEGDIALERFTDLLNREGFRISDEYDSRCWLGWRPASDGPTDFQ